MFAASKIYRLLYVMNDQDSTSFFRFEDLRIYAKVMDYITWLYREMKTISSDCDEVSLNLLKESFIKSAHAIALNTAEGSSRNKAQFLYYLKMAKSSVRECVVFTELFYKLNVFSIEAREYSRNELMELTKMIGSLISSLQRSLPPRSYSDREEDLDTMSDFDGL